jgi:hypothetical protein
MAGQDALAEGLLERIDRIALAQGAEGGCILVRARTAAADGVAGGAVLLQQFGAELEIFGAAGVLGAKRTGGNEERGDSQAGERYAACRSRDVRGCSGTFSATRRSLLTTLITSSMRTANSASVG